MRNTQILLRVLFFQDPQLVGVWNAQAIELDIAAVGADLEQAKRAFERTIAAYLKRCSETGHDPRTVLKPAPAMFAEIWDRFAEDTTPAERLPSVPAFMLPVVSHDPLPA